MKKHYLLLIVIGSFIQTSCMEFPEIKLPGLTSPLTSARPCSEASSTCENGCCDSLAMADINCDSSHSQCLTDCQIYNEGLRFFCSDGCNQELMACSGVKDAGPKQ